MKRCDPEQRETGLPAFDLVAHKETGVPGFGGIIFSDGLGEYSPCQTIDPDLASARRAWLVGKLDSSGLTVDFSRENRRRKVRFRGGFFFQHIVVSIETIGGQTIGYLACETSTGVQRDGFVHKEYLADAKNRSQFEGLGIMELAFSLAIEAVKAEADCPTRTLFGTIDPKNLASLLSRLHAPNLSEGGYFRHELKEYHSLTGLSDVYSAATRIYERADLEEIARLSQQCVQKARVR